MEYGYCGDAPSGESNLKTSDATDNQEKPRDELLNVISRTHHGDSKDVSQQTFVHSDRLFMN